MFKFKLFSIPFLIGITFLLLSCSNKTPTQSIDTAQLSGYVFQEVNGFFNLIPNAYISIGGYSTNSDSVGQYSIEIPLGEYSIMATHEQFDTTYTDSMRIRGDRSYFIRLLNGPTYSVSGVVTDTLGTVVEGAIVELDHLRDTTDINGEYLFQNVLSGQRSISCDYADYFIFIDSFEITNTNITKDINLTRQGYNISGTVSHQVDGLLNGIEVILDDSLYDTTDINGGYLFENIYIGEHQLQVFSSTYNYDIFQFLLGKSDLYKELIIGKSTIQKIFIEKDAVIKADDEINYSNDNFGEELILPLLAYYAEFLVYDSFFIGHHEISYHTSRLFMKAESEIDYISDSVFLVLPFSIYSYQQFGEIRFSGIASEWNELTITWNNQPAINTDYKIFDLRSESSNILVLNITSDSSLFSNSHGFRVSFVNEKCYFCDYGMQFFSSEHPDISKRPHILIYRTE